jgi:hypothetical protein
VVSSVFLAAGAAGITRRWWWLRHVRATCLKGEEHVLSYLGKEAFSTTFGMTVAAVLAGNNQTQAVVPVLGDSRKHLPNTA